MSFGAIIALSVIILWVVGVIIYAIYLKMHHRSIFEEECGVADAGRRLLKRYRAQKRREQKNMKKELH